MVGSSAAWSSTSSRTGSSSPGCATTATTTPVHLPGGRPQGDANDATSPGGGVAGCRRPAARAAANGARCGRGREVPGGATWASAPRCLSRSPRPRGRMRPHRELGRWFRPNLPVAARRARVTPPGGGVDTRIPPPSWAASRAKIALANGRRSLVGAESADWLVSGGFTGYRDARARLPSSCPKKPQFRG